MTWSRAPAHLLAGSLCLGLALANVTRLHSVALTGSVLAAFAIATILVLLLKWRGKIPAILWGAIVAIVLLGLVPIIVRSLAIYRVRVNVVSPQGTAQRYNGMVIIGRRAEGGCGGMAV